MPEHPASLPLYKLVEQSRLLNKIAHTIAVTLKRIGPGEDYTAETPEELNEFVWDCVVALIESQRQWKENAKELAEKAFDAGFDYSKSPEYRDSFQTWWDNLHIIREK